MYRLRFELLVAAGVLLTVATLVVAPMAGEVPGCATGSVIELELARTQDRAVELIGGCDEAGLDVLRDGLRADNLAFVPLYVASVALWSVMSTQLWWSSDRRRHLVVAAAVAIAVAGLFDLAENHLLDDVVDAAGADSAIGAAFWVSAVKWVLVLYAVPVSIYAMVRCIRALFAPKPPVHDVE